MTDHILESRASESGGAPRTVWPCPADPAHPPPPALFSRVGYRIRRCTTCGTILAETSFEQEQYESGGYYTMRFPNLESIENEWGMRWRWILRRLRDLGARGTLLDVGAGNGFFVHLAGQADFAARGIEISQAEIQFAREHVGVELEQAELAQVAGRPFDVLTLFNVIEHVPDPEALLREARAALRPGGIFAITTPNPACLRARVKGVERWEMVCPPHHLCLFTRSGLVRLLERTGFRTERYETLSTYMAWLRRMDLPGRPLHRGLFHALRGARMGADHFILARAAEDVDRQDADVAPLRRVSG